MDLRLRLRLFGGPAQEPGNSAKSARKVAQRGDNTAEGDETLFMNLGHPVNGTIADGQGICTILNDE
jgi:hypothetical protein